MKTSKKMLSLLLIAAMLVSVLCMGVSATGTYDEVSIGTGEPVTINWTTATTGTVVNVDASTNYIPKSFLLWARNGLTVKVGTTELTANGVGDTDSAYTVYTDAASEITITVLNGETVAYTITCPHYTTTITGSYPSAVNGSAYGTAINPYASAASVGNGGDGFDLSWAVDENGVPVKMSSAKYIRVYSAVLFNAGIFGETSAEVCGLYRTSNTITGGAGTTVAPTVKRNGVEVNFAAKTATQIDENVVYVKSKLAVGNTITVEAASGAWVFINGEATTSYTVTSTAKPVQIVVQNGDAEPYIVVLK